MVIQLIRLFHEPDNLGSSVHRFKPDGTVHNFASGCFPTKEIEPDSNTAEPLLPLWEARYMISTILQFCAALLTLRRDTIKELIFFFS